jgi:hypothetical protein
MTKGLKNQAELNAVAKEVSALKIEGKHLRLPDDLKKRIVELWKTGIPLITLCRTIGVQTNSVRTWTRQFSKKDSETLPFRIMTVEPPRTNNKPPFITFKFNLRNVTVDVEVSLLSEQLISWLTNC